MDSATRILDQAGWRPGAGGIRAKGDLRASFVLYYPPSDSARQAIAEGFKAQMQPLGIDVQLEGLDFTGIQENNRVNAVVLGGGNLTPYNVYRQLASAGTREKNWINIACYTNQSVHPGRTARTHLSSLAATHGIGDLFRHVNGA